MKSYNNHIRCYKFFGKYAWKTNKSYYLWAIMRYAIRTIGPFINIIGTRYLIDELISGTRDIATICLWIAFLCVGNFLHAVLLKVADENLNRINENFGKLLEVDLCMSCVNMKFEHTEDKEVLDIIKNAQRSLNETGHINGLIGPLFDIISSITVFVGVVVLVCTSIPWLLIPVTLSFISKTFISKKMNKQRKEYFDNMGKVERGSDYYDTELQDSRYAKDVRLYNTSEIFNENYDSITAKLYGMAKRYLLRFFGLYSVDDTIANICATIIYFLLGIYTIIGRITVGQFSGLYQATTQFNDSLHSILRKYMDIVYTVSVLIYYVEFVDRNLAVELEEEHLSELDISVKDYDIEFKDVSFKYPRTDKYVLKNVNLKIKAGEHLSIVGQNGAGKTTFIKLLCRLYNNYEGRILINGVDIQDYSFGEYIELLSVVFQDYKMFAFTVKENVTVFKERAVSLEETYKIAGVNEWIDSLENKDDTYVYKYFVEEGVEPSGGESQKLAIARALYKNAPVVILDEPTAALGPLAEYEVYKNFDKLVGGKTAIYISHRLSSCRFCDRIVVFDDGAIVEDGSHKQLINIENGLYANMYNTQAKHYK